MRDSRLAPAFKKDEAAAASIFSFDFTTIVRSR